jgi:hypothetical protein
MSKQKWLLCAVTLALIVGGGSVLQRLKANQRLGNPGVKVRPLPDGQRLQIDLPATVLNGESKLIEPTHEEVATLPKDTSIAHRNYTFADGFETQLTVVMMGSDRTSIHKPQFCLTGQGFKIERSELTTAPITRPHAYELPVMKLTASKTARMADGRAGMVRALYVYWFVAEDQLTAQHWQRMWWMARDLLHRGVLQRWAYVSCFSLCAPGQEDATFARMKEFIAEAVPQFQLVAGPQMAAVPGITRVP